MFTVTNYYPHPTNNLYTVFGHKIQAQSDYFESLLQKSNIKYEKHIEHEGEKLVIYYAISNIHMKVVKKMNFEAIGKFRQPFIPDIAVRYIILLVAFTAITLAILGYFMQH